MDCESYSARKFKAHRAKLGTNLTTLTFELSPWSPVVPCRADDADRAHVSNQFRQARRCSELHWYHDRVVRLLSLRHGGRTRLQPSVLPDIRPADGHARGLRHLRRRL